MGSASGVLNNERLLRVTGLGCTMDDVFWVDSDPSSVRTDKRIQRRPRRERDREAFHTESLALFGSVYRTALRLTRNAADAEDLTQETYVRALGASGSFQRGTNVFISRGVVYVIRNQDFVDLAPFAGQDVELEGEMRQRLLTVSHVRPLSVRRSNDDVFPRNARVS